jgi:hypothetical protein
LSRRLVHTGPLPRALLLLALIVGLQAQIARADTLARAAILVPRTHTVSGRIRFAARVVPRDARAVVFLIDGRRAWTARRRPFRYGRHGLLDTRRLRNGSHVLSMIVLSRRGRKLAVARVRILVRNYRPAPHRPKRHTGASASTARAGTIAAFGPPPGGVPGAAVAAFNRETYQYSSGLSLSQEAGSYQVLVLQATDGRLVAALHADNPRLKILVYQHPWQSAPSDPGALHVCTSYADDTANHPDWFLKGPSGAPLLTRGGSGYVMDLGNAVYQQACVANMVSLAKRYGFDGVFIDDLPATWQWDLPVGASVPEYPTNAAWQGAVTSFVNYAGPALHAAGLMSVGNLCGTPSAPGLWQQWSSPLDGAEEESWTDGGAGPAQQAHDWPTKLADVAWSEAHGKYVLVHSYSTTQAGNDFGLASLLLVAGGHSSYSTSNANYTSAETLYPDYSSAAQLGAPAGPYVRLGNGVYERAFSGGIVLVNPTLQAIPSFSLGGGAYSGSGLTAVRSVAMGPTSGLILTKVG